MKIKDKAEGQEDVTMLDIDIKPTQEDLLRMLEEMGKNIESLPPHAMSQPVTHYDFGSLISLLTVIIRELIISKTSPSCLPNHKESKE